MSPNYYPQTLFQTRINFKTGFSANFEECVQH